MGYLRQCFLFICVITTLLVLTHFLYSDIADARGRVIYFVPNDRIPQNKVHSTIDTQMKAIQAFYAQQMNRHGYGNKTFELETDRTGKVITHQMVGNHTDAYYLSDTLNNVRSEIQNRFNTETDIYVAFVELSNERVNESCGIAQYDGGPVMIPASGDCVQGEAGVDLIAHELGHAFNLVHDFRSDDYIMSYGAERNRLSRCAAELLDVSPYFNDRPKTQNRHATVQMLTPTMYPANIDNWTLKFDVYDVDGIHQVQFELATPGEPASLFDCASVQNRQRKTVEFEMPAGSTIDPTNHIWIRVVDVNGNVDTQEWILTVLKRGTPTRTVSTDDAETMLTLSYDAPDALVPTNNKTEWQSWLTLWEKTPDGLLPRKPHGLSPVSAFKGETWKHFFYAHAPSRIVYDISGGNYESFDAFFDMPNPCGNIASIEVIFLADEQEIYNSGILQGSEGRHSRITFNIPEGTKILTLKVTDVGDPGCDHFVFGNPKLIHRISETIVTTTTTPTTTPPETGRNQTYLTLSYDADNSLIPTNSKANWDGWLGHIWEKTPDGQITQKPPYYLSHQYSDVWDNWFYAHAQSRIVYNVSDLHNSQFDGWLYLAHLCSDNNPPASMEFIGYADGSKIYNSGIKRGDKHNDRNTHIVFDIPENTTTFTIEISTGIDGGTCDHFVIGNARLLHSGTSTPTPATRRTDINSDGVVNLVDIVIVASRYGERITGNPNPNPDVNRDGVVDIDDLILVSKEMPVGAAPPVLPIVTQLLPNYPNPCNPETWIPYQLSHDANVNITVYGIDGKLIRKLDVGYKPAGLYTSKSRSAYWDGANMFGEAVASGVYFYTLTAGDFTTTRKLLIQR